MVRINFPVELGYSYDEVSDWARAVLPDADVTNDFDDHTHQGVVMYPLSWVPRRQLAADHVGSSYLFGVRYLVSAIGSEAEGQLGALLADALTRPDWVVELEPLPTQAWRALGVSPRPSFLLDVEMSLPSKRQGGPQVLSPLGVGVASTRTLNGVILGPGDIPVPMARVELTGMNVHTISDGKGRFSFATAPGNGESELRLRVTAKGEEFRATANLDETSEPLVIRCDLAEE